MTGVFADLAEFGITEETVVKDREVIAHNMIAEDFLEHMGYEVPAEPDDAFYEAADEFLAHFGIMGMKWGRRRPRGANGLVDKSAKATVDRSKLAGARRSKPESSAKSMTNDELQSAIRRLQMEQQYAQLTAKRKPALRAEVEKIVVNALRQNAQAYLTQYTGVAIGAALKKAGVPNAQEIAEKAKKEREDAAKAEKDKKQD